VEDFVLLKNKGGASRCHGELVEAEGSAALKQQQQPQWKQPGFGDSHQRCWDYSSQLSGKVTSMCHPQVFAFTVSPTSKVCGHLHLVFQILLNPATGYYIVCHKEPRKDLFIKERYSLVLISSAKAIRKEWGMWQYSSGFCEMLKNIDSSEVKLYLQEKPSSPHGCGTGELSGF
jgi:hypothetical protein